MKKVFFYLLFSFQLTLEAAAQVPTWSAEINNTIAKLQPKFRTTSTKFSKISLERSEIGGGRRDSCPNLLPFALEVYKKEIILLNTAKSKRFKIELEIYITESPEVAKKMLKGILELRQFTGTDGFGCPQPITDKKPLLFITYHNILIVSETDAFQNAEVFNKYATAFEANLNKQQ